MISDWDKKKSLLLFSFELVCNTILKVVLNADIRSGSKKKKKEEKKERGWRENANTGRESVSPHSVATKL